MIEIFLIQNRLIGHKPFREAPQILYSEFARLTFVRNRQLPFSLVPLARDTYSNILAVSSRFVPHRLWRGADSIERDEW